VTFVSHANIMKTLVLFVFHEYNDRVKNFIDKSVFKNDNVDFLFICNKKDINITIPEYVSIIKRDNIGYDFGGWSEGIFHNNNYKKYDYFIFVNSSVIGPFLRDKTERWTDIFITALNDDIKLFGSTINCIDNPKTDCHIQSYIFSMDKNTLQYLIDKELFSKTNVANTFDEAVIDKEIRMSRLIIENGWNIGCLMPIYKEVDFRFKDGLPKDVLFKKDIMYDNFYKEGVFNEFDNIFIKGNRGIEVSMENFETLSSFQYAYFFIAAFLIIGILAFIYRRRNRKKWFLF